MVWFNGSCSLLVFILFVRTARNDSHSDWSLCCNCCNIWRTSGFCPRPSVIHYVQNTTVLSSVFYKCQSPSLCWQYTPFLFFSSGPHDSALTSIQSTIFCFYLMSANRLCLILRRLSFSNQRFNSAAIQGQYPVSPGISIVSSVCLFTLLATLASALIALLSFQDLL